MPRTGVADGLWFEVHPGPDNDAPAVILSPGLGGSAGFWAPQMQALTARFAVVLYDHRGAGRSDRTLTDPHSVDAMAEDIVAVMDAAGLARAHLVGHAAGGLAGLALALNHPDRLDRLVVKGKTLPITVFEVLGRAGAVSEAVLARRDAFERALDLHDARDFAGALAIFESLAAADPPSKVYAERCEAYLTTPPPADWQGEFQLKTK